MTRSGADERAPRNETQSGQNGRDRGSEQRHFDARPKSRVPHRIVDAGDLVALYRDRARLRPADARSGHGPNADPGEEECDSGAAQPASDSSG